MAAVPRQRVTKPENEALLHAARAAAAAVDAAGSRSENSGSISYGYVMLKVSRNPGRK
jgi:hypothetical protein